MSKRRSTEDNESHPKKKICSPEINSSRSQRRNQSRRSRDSSESSCVENHKRSRSSRDSDIDARDVSTAHDLTAGRLLKIVLKNFMCHEHLRVTFNNRINFICGKNGSGKSAILTAIVVGLGGRATDANRGDLKNLLLSGSNYASVEVTLSNLGVKAFKPDVYGDEITVLRTLTESTDNKVTSQFKMLSKTGKVIASAKGELTRMLVAFGLKIDNPVTILNQDMARNFLKSSKPADLYKFFSWSTGLGTMEKKLLENEMVMTKIEKDLETKTKELEFSSRDVLEIKKKHDMKNDYDQLVERIAALKNELNWTKVLVLSKDKENKTKTVRRLKENIAELQKKYQNKDTIEAEILERKRQLEDELATISDDYSKNLSEQSLTDREFATKRAELENLVVRHKKLEIQLGRDEECLKKQTDQLKNLTSLNSETAARREALAKELSELERKLQELKNVQVVNETHSKNLLEDKNKKSDMLLSVEQKVNHIIQQKNATARTISSLKSKEKALDIYADWMPALVNKIKTAAALGAFSATPIGPLGQYIKLREDRFGAVIEKFIGGRMLRCFCCSTDRDTNALRKLFRELNIQNPPLIVTSKFLDKVHDVRQFETRHGQYGSLFSALEFTSPVVANCLIDQLEIENILLVPTDQETFPLVEVQENVPVNCKRVLTPDNMYYPAPNYRSYSMDVAKTASFLHKDKERQIKEKMVELEELKQSEVELRQELDKARAQLRDADKRVLDAEREALKVKSNYQRIDQKLFMLKNQEEPMEMNELFITEDIEYRKQHIKKLQDEFQVIKEQLKEVEKFVKELNSKKNALKTLTKNHSTKVSSIKVQISEVVNEIRELNDNFKKFQKKCEDEERKVAVLEKNISQLHIEIEAQEKEAYDSGNNPTDFRDINEVKQDLLEVESQAREIRSILGDGDLEQLTEEYANRLEKLSDSSQLLKLTTFSLEKWKALNDNLKENFTASKIAVSANVQHQMQIYLRLRNYQGNLIIKHETKKIEITVRMSTDDRAASQSAICMSGGERSYSMVAFILSLWNETRVPFYCLDEFDVFMDPVNRKLVINLLVAHARNRKSHQFIFLTPNDFHTDLDEDVGVFRLNDPRQEAT